MEEESMTDLNTREEWERYGIQRGWWPKEHETPAARATDPETSRKAVLNRKMGWDTMKMRALRVFFDNQDEEFGLSHHEVQGLAEQEWGDGALGKSPWKRSGELHTTYDPPLIDRIKDAQGNLVVVGGEFGDPVESFKITAAGRALVEQGMAGL